MRDLWLFLLTISLVLLVTNCAYRLGYAARDSESNFIDEEIAYLESDK